jgi:beta-lactamase class A
MRLPTFRPRRRLALGLVLLAACGTRGAPDGAMAPRTLPEARIPSSARETPDPELQAKLERLVAGFPGEVGVYVRHLRTGRSAAIAADTIFPTASMIKVPILVATFQAVEDGRLDWHAPLVYTDSLHYAGTDILGSFRDSATITPSRLVMLMLTMSDNTASLWLQHVAGTGTRINEWLARHGFESTRMNSRTPGRRGDWERYGWGQTTPREMSELLVTIREGRAVSRGASEEMYRALARTYWNGEAVSRIPPWVQAASKQGAVDRSRSETVLVNAPGGDYVFTVITKNQRDTTYAADNPGYVLLRDVSAALWTHFEPERPYAPAEGAARYKPQEE